MATKKPAAKPAAAKAEPVAKPAKAEPAAAKAEPAAAKAEPTAAAKAEPTATKAEPAAKPAKTEPAAKLALQPLKAARHKIVDVSTEVLHWGKIAPANLLPPPDTVVRCRLVDSVPEVHNMLRRAAMNSLRVYALAHVSINTDDKYCGRDETRARVGLIRIRQADAKWGARTVLKLKVLNETSEILPVTTDSFTRSDGIRDNGCIGAARIATLAPGKMIEITCEVQLATATVGAGHRATGCFRAYGLDYQNVGTIDAESKPGSAWVRSAELTAIVGHKVPPTETPVLVARGGEYRIVPGSETKYYKVAALPETHSSTNTCDSNFGLEFRLEACWDPATFLGLVTARLVEVLQGMRDTLAAGGVAATVEAEGVVSYMFADVDKCYGGLLRAMIAEMDADVFTNYTCVNQHTDGFRIRIAHPRSAELLMASVQRAITIYETML